LFGYRLWAVSRQTKSEYMDLIDRKNQKNATNSLMQIPYFQKFKQKINSCISGKHKNIQQSGL
jgi:hypothetical protein